MRMALVLVGLAACSTLPWKKQSGVTYRDPPGENERHWETGAKVDTLEGFRSYVTGVATAEVVVGLEGPCGKPSGAHVLDVEIAHTVPGIERVYVSTHGAVIVSEGRVIGATAPVADCGALPSEIVAVHAGFWAKGSAFPGNPHSLVVIDRVGTQTRQRLFTHWPIGTLTESFSFVIADEAEPGVARRMQFGLGGEELFTQGPHGEYHWVSEESRFVPGRKMSKPTRKAF